jgi:hypothetical protein
MGEFLISFLRLKSVDRINITTLFFKAVNEPFYLFLIGRILKGIKGCKTQANSGMSGENIMTESPKTCFIRFFQVRA